MAAHSAAGGEAAVRTMDCRIARVGAQPPRSPRQKTPLLVLPASAGEGAPALLARSGSSGAWAGLRSRPSAPLARQDRPGACLTERAPGNRTIQLSMNPGAAAEPATAPGGEDFAGPAVWFAAGHEESSSGTHPCSHALLPCSPAALPRARRARSSPSADDTRSPPARSRSESAASCTEVAIASPPAAVPLSPAAQPRAQPANPGAPAAFTVWSGA
jgi:hypothetical protein